MSTVQSSRPAMHRPGYYLDYEGCNELASRDITESCLACWFHMCPSYVSPLTTRMVAHSLLISGQVQRGQ